MFDIFAGLPIWVQVLFFVVTLFASFTFGWAFYAATVERQRRLAASADKLVR